MKEIACLSTSFVFSSISSNSLYMKENSLLKMAIENYQSCNQWVNFSASLQKQEDFQHFMNEHTNDSGYLTIIREIIGIAEQLI